MNDLTFCQYRLPCGHCERLDRMCPYTSGSNYFSTNPLIPPYILTGNPPNSAYDDTGITSTTRPEINPDALINITTDVTYDIDQISSTSICSKPNSNGCTTARNNSEKGS